MWRLGFIGYGMEFCAVRALQMSHVFALASFVKGLKTLSLNKISFYISVLL
jgi:hypothetical protein